MHLLWRSKWRSSIFCRQPKKYFFDSLRRTIFAQLVCAILWEWPWLWINNEQNLQPKRRQTVLITMREVLHTAIGANFKIKNFYGYNETLTSHERKKLIWIWHSNCGRFFSLNQQSVPRSQKSFPCLQQKRNRALQEWIKKEGKLQR